MVANTRRNTFIALGLMGLLLATAAPTVAKKNKNKGASTAPGEYSAWGGEIDELKIVKTFQRADFGKVVVADFDTSKTPLPDADDNAHAPVKDVLGAAEGSLVKGLQKGGVQAERGSGGAGSLVVKTTVVEMDPGSRAARYWGGFGAGAARVVLEIAVFDGGSNAKLLEIKQERRSGVGVGGGKYDKLLHRSLRQIGEDVAMVLEAF